MFQDRLEYQIHDYFMAIVSYFKWNIDFRSYFLTCSQLLNMLEETGFLRTESEKELAARMLLEEWSAGSKSKFDEAWLKRATMVLVYDHTQKADSHIYMIDEIYETGHARANISRKEYISKHPNASIEVLTLIS